MLFFVLILGAGLISSASAQGTGGSPYPNITNCALRIDTLTYMSTVTYRRATGYDVARLFILNNSTAHLNYTWQHSQCYRVCTGLIMPDLPCPVFHVTIQPGGYCQQEVQTAHRNIIVGYLDNVPGIPHIISCNDHFVDKGNYTVTFRPTVECIVTDLTNPDNPDLAWLWVFLFYAGLAVIWVLLTFLYRRGLFEVFLRPLKRLVTGRSEEAVEPLELMTYKQVENTYELEPVSNGTLRPNGLHAPDHSQNNGATTTTGDKTITASSTTTKTNDTLSQATPALPAPSAVETPKPPKQRLNSLDAFRGLSLTIMIFVNYGGAGYWYFEHASWNGLTMADTVFPWFLWMMGTSMVFSFRGILKRKTRPILVVWQIFWRATKLFAIGLCMGARSVDLKIIRIPGVLQRFGITYLFAALIYYPFAHKATSDNVHILGDIIFFWGEWLIHAALLTVYLGLTFALPVPGCPTGYLGPGGLEQMGWYQNCTGGAAGYADTQMLTVNHIYRWPTSGEVYYTTMPFDPEGFFTVIPTIFLCLLGNQAGKIIVMHKGHKKIIIRWLIWAVGTGCLALLLCEAKQNGGWIPINKNLWSLSYIFAMAATSFLLLAAMYIVIDVLQLWNGAPFIYPGKNSIVIYICHSVFASYFPITWVLPSSFVHWEKLLQLCWSTSFWLFVAYILYRKRIYVAL